MTEQALRAGLRPRDVKRMRPVEVYEVFDAWRWRWSRNLEVAMTAAVLGGLAPGKLDPFAACKCFGLYEPLKPTLPEPE